MLSAIVSIQEYPHSGQVIVDIGVLVTELPPSTFIAFKLVPKIYLVYMARTHSTIRSAALS